MADHFIFPASGRPRKFKTPFRGYTPPVKRVSDPQAQAFKVKSDLRSAFEAADAIKQRRRTESSKHVPSWSYLEITAPEASFAPERYEDEGIELLSARSADDGITATVIVSDQARDTYVRKVDEYLSLRRTEKNNRINQAFVDSIVHLSCASARSFWTDSTSFPEGPGQHWWELWLVADRSTQAEAAAAELGIPLSNSKLHIDDRDIRVVKATPLDINALVENSHAIAEIRAAGRASVPGAAEELEFDESELERRLEVPLEASTYVCLLDTGVNAAHRLIRPALDQRHFLALSPANAADRHGHGTQMAGLALYGDLREILGASTPVRLTHRLESVSMPLEGSASSEEEALRFMASVTREAMRLAERQNPRVNHVYCLALSLRKGSDGKHSSWSIAIDDAATHLRIRHLFVISAGNMLGVDGEVISELDQSHYHSINGSTPIHEPAQAWNALTVGGCTELCAVPPGQGTALARSGDLSPYSTTTAAWPKQPAPPIKPDIVMEAGNMAYVGNGPATFHKSLEMLSTHFRGGLTEMAQTSGAAAIGARLAARVWSRYPHLQPESIRAIVINSARWTDAMVSRFGKNQKTRAKGLRYYGYGVPNENLALESGNDGITIVCEGQITPYQVSDGRVGGAEMIVHKMPWPIDLLKQIYDQDLELGVTLSYFVEPLAGARSYRGKYPYQSHGLRFAVQRPGENEKQFLDRVSKDARGNNYKATSTKDKWNYGRPRDKGSIVSDFSVQPAADLQDRIRVVVYPAGTGWWKDRDPVSEFRARRVRYSLVVSLRPVGVSPIDKLYTSVEAVIATPAPVELEVLSVEI